MKVQSEIAGCAHLEFTNWADYIAQKWLKGVEGIILGKRHGAWCFKRSENAEILMPLTLVAQIFTLDT